MRCYTGEFPQVTERGVPIGVVMLTPLCARWKHPWVIGGIARVLVVTAPPRKWCRHAQMHTYSSKCYKLRNNFQESSAATRNIYTGSACLAVPTWKHKPRVIVVSVQSQYLSPCIKDTGCQCESGMSHHWKTRCNTCLHAPVSSPCISGLGLPLQPQLTFIQT